MQILVTGPAVRRGAHLSALSEQKAEGTPAVEFTATPTPSRLGACDVLIDLVFDQHPEKLPFYVSHCPEQAFFILHSNCISLRETARGLGLANLLPQLAGINAWPGCLDGPLWEMSTAHDGAHTRLTEISKTMGFQLERVEDRVGLVTPRVMCMIINEAFLTLQEGTAGREDIDLAMKLGTNYPGGPFEWAEKWGLDEVARLLHRLQQSTGDPRYVRSHLLIEEAGLTTATEPGE